MIGGPRTESGPNRFAAIALLGIAVTAAYLNSLWAGFQFDDFNVIVFNPVVHSLDAWWADLGYGIRPLLKLTYAINWDLGFREMGFHAFNVGLHAVNTLLVWWLARRLVANWAEPAAGPAASAAFIAALLFALHPAHTEAVTYVSGRSTSLMATFYLGAFAAYVAGAARGTGSDGRWRTHGLALLLFCLALATKETAVTLPFALLLWEASRRDTDAPRATARRLAMFFVVLFGAAAALRLHPVYSERLIPDLAANALYGNALTQIDAVVFLGSRLIFPYPLNIDPDLRAVTAWSPLLAAKAILLLASLWIGIAALRKTGRRPWWGFAIFWFYLQLAPTNSLLPRLDVANDRQLYLASFGACVAVAAEAALLRASLSSARAWTQQAFAAALAVVAALFLGLTIARNQDYRAEISLWEQTARWSPAKPRVRNNLGYAYSAAGCIDKAQAQYREALRLDPAYRIARDNLAIVSMRSSSESTCAMAAARRP